MKKYFSLYLLLLALFLLPACQSSRNNSASRMLRFNYEAGKGYDYELVMQLNQEILGQPMNMDMRYYYSMDVEAAAGEQKLISTTVDRLQMDINVAGMKMKVDSEDPAASAAEGDENSLQRVSNMMAAIKGRRFTMLVNPEGQIVSMKGFKEMAGAIADSLAVDEKEKEEFRKRFEQQWGEQSTREQFENFLFILPNREVKVGESWTKTSTMGGPAAGKYVSTYKVTEIEGDMVTLEDKTRIEPGGEGMALKGQRRGTVVVDSRSGLIVNADYTLDMTAGQGELEINLKGTSKVKGKARP